MWPFGGDKKKKEGGSGSPADTPPENVFDDTGGGDSRFDTGDPATPLGSSGQQPESSFGTAGVDDGFAPAPLPSPQSGEPPPSPPIVQSGVLTPGGRDIDGFDESDGGKRSDSAPAPRTSPEDQPTQGQIVLERNHPACAIYGAMSFFSGAQLGLVVGGAFGIREGYLLWNAGAQTRVAMQHVLARSVGTAASFGIYLGVYQGVKCSSIVFRGKKDMWNAGYAGAAAGSIGTLRTGNPAQIAGAAAFGGALMMAMESLSGH